ncbi:unnamed protein product [marine sediment metagenome]|uniref:Uncharacterized protein n=1 Tax=marine sediment metagenome TaxID=412755 RepID=X1F557_9ZZZZ
MIRSRRLIRGAVSTNVMLGIVIGLIVASLGVFLVITVPRQKRQREVKEKMVEERTGKAGRATDKRYLPERKPGINLPIADQAQDGAAEPDTTVELPIEYAADFSSAAEKMDSRFRDIARTVGREGLATTRITLKADRDLEYRFLVKAVLLAAENGFTKCQVACLKKATAEDVGYLNLDLPTRDLRVIFRIVEYDEETVLYVLGTTKPKRTPKLEEVTVWLKSAASKGADQPVLILMPSITVTVQRFTDALNAGRFAGFKEIGLAKPPKLD